MLPQHHIRAARIIGCLSCAVARHHQHQRIPGRNGIEPGRGVVMPTHLVPDVLRGKGQRAVRDGVAALQQGRQAQSKQDGGSHFVVPVKGEHHFRHGHRCALSGTCDRTSPQCIAPRGRNTHDSTRCQISPTRHRWIHRLHPPAKSESLSPPRQHGLCTGYGCRSATGTGRDPEQVVKLGRGPPPFERQVSWKGRYLPWSPSRTGGSCA